MDPANGDDGYICQQPTSGESSAHIYVTRDGGQTWTRAADVPVGANPQPSNTAGKPDHVILPTDRGREHSSDRQ